MGSVKILKEIEGYVTERYFIHDLDIEKGENLVVGKVVTKDFILVLRRNKEQELSSVEYKLLNKILVTLKQRVQGVTFTRREVMSIMGILKKVPRLKYMDKLVMYIRGKGFLTEEEIIEWEDEIKCTLREVVELTDVSEKYRVIGIDDGISSLEVLVESELVGEIEKGDIVEIVIGKNHVKEEQGYILSSLTGKEYEYIVRGIEKRNTVRGG